MRWMAAGGVEQAQEGGALTGVAEDTPEAIARIVEGPFIVETTAVGEQAYGFAHVFQFSGECGER